MSDKVEENLEIYTKDGKPTGNSKPRGKIHSDGDYHKAVKIWNVNSYIKKKKLIFCFKQRGNIDSTKSFH